jgi:hypothetical protein
MPRTSIALRTVTVRFSSDSRQSLRGSPAKRSLDRGPFRAHLVEGKRVSPLARHDDEIHSLWQEIRPQAKALPA